MRMNKTTTMKVKTMREEEQIEWRMESPSKSCERDWVNAFVGGVCMWERD